MEYMKEILKKYKIKVEVDQDDAIDVKPVIEIEEQDYDVKPTIDWKCVNTTWIKYIYIHWIYYLKLTIVSLQNFHELRITFHDRELEFLFGEILNPMQSYLGLIRI